MNATKPAKPAPTVQKTVWWAVSASVVLGVAGLSGVGVVTWMVQERHSATDTYQADRIKAVQVDAGPAAVNITPENGPQALVTQNMRWVFSKPTVTEWLDGATGTLHVDANCVYGKFLGGRSCDVQLDISVPAGTPINADGGSGSLSVSGMTGPITARGGSGEIRFDHVSGPVNALVGSGQIDGTNLLGTKVVAQAGSGEVDLDFALPPTTVTAGVTSGQVSIALPRGTQYRVAAVATSGDAQVDPALKSPTATGTVTVSVTSGEADVHFR